MLSFLFGTTVHSHPNLAKLACLLCPGSQVFVVSLRIETQMQKLEIAKVSCVGYVRGAALTRLAFVTLGCYDFAYNPKRLEPIKMLGYLDDQNETIRRAAALAFCRVQHRHAKLQLVGRSKGGRPAGALIHHKVSSRPSVQTHKNGISDSQQIRVIYRIPSWLRPEAGCCTSDGRK